MALKEGPVRRRESKALNTWLTESRWPAGSGCLGGKCAQRYWHMFPQVFDLLVSQNTLLSDQKNTLESCDSKEKLKIGDGGEESLIVPLSPLCH